MSCLAPTGVVFGPDLGARWLGWSGGVSSELGMAGVGPIGVGKKGEEKRSGGGGERRRMKKMKGKERKRKKKSMVQVFSGKKNPELILFSK